MQGKERFFWVCTVALLLAVNAVLAAGFGAAPVERTAHPAHSGAHEAEALPALSEHHDERYQASGLTEPAHDILQDLLGRPELIPHEAVLGGQMTFVEDESFVLTDRWVLATYADGHVQGRAVFEYTVSPLGTIAWTPLSAYLDQ